MTIDERLELLVQSTESLHSTSHDHAERLDNLTAKIDSLTVNLDNLTAKLDNLTGKVDKLTDKMLSMTDAVNVLIQAVTNHEFRIKRLEAI